MNIRDKVIAALYRATTPRDLALALFTFFSELIPNHSQMLFLRLNSSKLHAYCSHPEEQLAHVLDLADSSNSLLLEGSLKKPARSLVRLNRLHRHFMTKMRTKYAISLMAERLDAWEVCLTILRSKRQGRFSKGELKALKDFRPYLQSSIERLLRQDEEELCLKTLETFIWSLPSAIIILNWELKVLYFNATALELSECWKMGLLHTHTKRAKAMRLPRDILLAVEQEKIRKPNPRGSNKALFLLDIHHPHLPDLKAKVYFHPNQSTSLNEGTFLISLHRQNSMPDDQQTYDCFVNLSPRERDVVLLAARGEKSNQIAKYLGTAPITVRMQLSSAYKKLAIKSRYELVNRFSHNPLFAGKLSSPTRAGKMS